MPANLTPDYKDAEERYRKASSPNEKQAALEDMLATIPKHKGTEKLVADIRRRMARLRKEDESRSGGKRQHITVAPAGCAQVMLVGPPNAGKSQILASLTNAEPEVAAYPFTTQLPQPGMVLWENVQIQLVDMPPISEVHLEGWVGSLLRTADAALLVANLGDDDLLEQTETTLRVLEAQKLFLVTPGRSPESYPPSHVYLRTLLLAWQADQPGAAEREEMLRELVGDRFEVVAGSAAEDTTGLARKLFDFLELIRIYTRSPGKEPDRNRPFVLPSGSTVEEVAEMVHKDFADKLKFARVWGSSTFEGQKVQRDYILSDQDVLEFHA